MFKSHHKLISVVLFVIVFQLITATFGSMLVHNGSTNSKDFGSLGIAQAVGADGKCADGSDPKDFTLPDGTTKSATCIEDLTPAERRDYDQEVCKSEGLSWLICPIINFLVESIEKAEQIVVGLLRTAPLAPFDPSSTDPVFKLWEQARNIANILLVVVFLFMIIGNAASFGVDSYTIKRTLPRLIAAAIGIQFSWLFCSILIDISNLLGVGIIKIVSDALAALSLSSVGGIDQAAFSLGAVIGAAALVAAIASGAAIFILIAAVLAILGTLVTLAFREIMILILVIASPLALLAWVLPNTENLFKVWGKNLVKIVMMFPMIAALLAISRVAAVISLRDGEAFSGVIAVLIMIAPLFAIPFTFKWAGGAMAAAAGAVSGFAAGTGKKISGSQGAKDFQERRREQNAINAQRQDYGAFGRSRRGISQLGAAGVWGATAGRAVGRTANRDYRRRLQRQATSAASKRVREAQESAAIEFASLDGATNGPALNTLPGVSPAAAAAARIGAAQSSAASRRFIDITRRLAQNPTDLHLQGEFAAGLEHMANINDTNSLVLAKSMMEESGNLQTYNTLAGPISSIGDKAPEAAPGGPWVPTPAPGAVVPPGAPAPGAASLRAQQLIDMHHSSVQRLVTSGDISGLRPGTIAELAQSPNRGSFRNESLQALIDHANAHAPGTNAIADEIRTHINVVNGTWI